MLNDLEWVTSSFCNNSACVQVAWRKSSKSNPSGNSVEVLDDPCQDVIYVQDSKNPGPVQVYSRETWSGGYSVVFEPIMQSDLPADLNLAEHADSVSWYRVTYDGLNAEGTPDRVELYFDTDERYAFWQGVIASEFADA